MSQNHWKEPGKESLQANYLLAFLATQTQMLFLPPSDRSSLILLNQKTILQFTKLASEFLRLLYHESLIQDKDQAKNEGFPKEVESGKLVVIYTVCDLKFD